MKPIFQAQVFVVSFGLFACAGAQFNSGGQQQVQTADRKAQNSTDQSNTGAPGDNNTDQNNSGKNKNNTTDQKNSGGNKNNVDQSGTKGAGLGTSAEATSSAKGPVDSASATQPVASTDGATLKNMLNTPKPQTDDTAATLQTLSAGGALLGTVLSNLPPGNPNGGPNNQDPNDAGEPLIIDMSGNGISLSAPADGPLFDIFANNTHYHLSWPVNPSQSIWLVHVVKGQPFAQNVSTLFGTKTLGPDGKIAPDGFSALAKYDLPLYGGHGTGILDKSTTIWSELYGWQNMNRDGVINLADLHTLDELGIQKIAVKNLATGKCDKDQYNNWTGSRSVVCVGSCESDDLSKWSTRSYFDLWFTIPGFTNTPPPCGTLVDAFKLK